MMRNQFPWIAVLSAAIGLCASCGSNSNSGAAAPGTAPAPTVEVAQVSSRKLSITVRLPGELQPYEAVAVFPKVTAYVDSISVDRGSRVKAGQLLGSLRAPGMCSR